MIEIMPARPGIAESGGSAEGAYRSDRHRDRAVLFAQLARSERKGLGRGAYRATSLREASLYHYNAGQALLDSYTGDARILEGAVRHLAKSKRLMELSLRRAAELQSSSP